jgi:hypothetical protein
MVCHQAVLAGQDRLGRGRLQHADAEGLSADLVFLAVHAQQFGIRELRDIRLRGEHLGGVGRDVDAQVLGKRFGDGAVFLRRGGGAELERVRQDAGQHRALHALGRLRRSSPIILCMMVAVQASGSMRDVDRTLRLEPADQLVVVDDRADVGGVDVLGQFGGVVGVDDDDGLAGSTPSMIAGLSRPQRASMKAASVLGSPRRTGLASVPAISLRYQAQMMGEPVLSVSGDLWPKTRVVMTGLSRLKFDLRPS